MNFSAMLILAVQVLCSDPKVNNNFKTNELDPEYSRIIRCEYEVLKCVDSTDNFKLCKKLAYSFNGPL